MQDDGLLIQPTHRLIGNLGWFDAEALQTVVGKMADVVETPVPPDKVGAWADEQLPKLPPHTLGLYDGKHGKLYELRIKNNDVLKDLEPTQSEAWRRLDVAILQRYLLDDVIQPNFADGKEITKGYVSDASKVVPQTDGSTYQIALLLQSTPLHALEGLGKHNEVMPQKSTYFYPKLATGLVINSLR